MTQPNELLEEIRVKSVTHYNKGNFPMIVIFESNTYEIRYTPKGGLMMKRYEPGPRAREPLTEVPNPA